MNILLISPASGKWRRIGRRRMFNGKTFRFSMLSLLTVAKLSPPDARITIIDEQLEDIPTNEDFDIVGVTAMTATASRAYEIAADFKKRGIPVVMGGFHATLNTAEALEHVDTVVAGCAFGAWEQLLEDLKTGNLQKIYYGDPEAKVPESLPRDFISNDKYVTINATYATLGCTNRCKFCSISAFHNARQYTRNIDDVTAEVASFKDRFFIFVDDNLTQNREYVFELLTKLQGLGKKWVTQASIDIADDDSLLKLMSDAGCVGVFVGLETFNDKTLRLQEKAIKAAKQYRTAVKKIHNHGMFIESGVIFGFDDDDVNVFASTLDMLESIGIDAIQVSILTPQPGTDLHEQMKGRIIDTDWEHYDYRHVVFQPENMTADQLQAGADWVIRKFYSPWRILMRFMRWMTLPKCRINFKYLLIPNLAYYGRTRAFNIHGYDPSKGSADSAPKRILAKWSSFLRKKQCTIRQNVA